MHDKDEVSINTNRRCVILANGILVIALAAIALLINTKPDIFGVAYGQDLNPPTTGKTSPHITSTFGPNVPGRANGSSIIGNVTQGNFSTNIAADGNATK